MCCEGGFGWNCRGKGCVVGEQGGGTAARILLDVWPSRKLEGWEIDGMVSRCTSHLWHIVQLHGVV
jgi:hypothetical protein